MEAARVDFDRLRGFIARAFVAVGMPSVERIWMPGEQSHERRVSYARDGIPLAPAAWAALDAVAADLEIPPLERLP